MHFEMVKEVLPSSAFFGNGPNTGPQIFMIDDSSCERSAIVCTFHFLQRRWTWLHDGKNGVTKNDRLILIEQLKNMVYYSNVLLCHRDHGDILSKETLESC